ncbi:MAG: hypothetical protein J6M91_03690 [Methanobrevibacter sp.]|nr:hypothetical protein [Methanobrevibacter sp.]
MYHEATIKVRINYCDKMETAENIVENAMKYWKEFDDAAIVFIGNPRLIHVEEKGISCFNCTHHSVEEEIIGDRGFGIETKIHHLCSKNDDDIRPVDIHFCEDYQKKWMECE